MQIFRAVVVFGDSSFIHLLMGGGGGRRNMRYKAIIFDYDRVVADTLEANFKAWQMIGREFGFEIATSE